MQPNNKGPQRINDATFTFLTDA